MSKTLPLSEVKSKLSEIVDEVATTHERVTVTRNGRPIAVLVSIDDLEAIDETIALLSDPGAMDNLAAGRAAIAAGDVATKSEIEELLVRLRSEIA
ncbi:MAG TPA: type II toxin-antitoxin system Phd/YefM family antitoxin [Actinobacteria bacterium]|nr:type II toxin-antitoxin system Phd/YefM family antitoxin [Actinomycetota bacterium]